MKKARFAWLSPQRSAWPLRCPLTDQRGGAEGQINFDGRLDIVDDQDLVAVRIGFVEAVKVTGL